MPFRYHTCSAAGTDDSRHDGGPVVDDVVPETVHLAGLS